MVVNEALPKANSCPGVEAVRAFEGKAGGEECMTIGGLCSDSDRAKPTRAPVFLSPPSSLDSPPRLVSYPLGHQDDLYPDLRRFQHAVTTVETTHFAMTSNERGEQSLEETHEADAEGRWTTGPSVPRRESIHRWSPRHQSKTSVTRPATVPEIIFGLKSSGARPRAI